MGWSGGTFSRVHDWTTDEGGAIDIEASRMDAEDDNLRDGINACLHKGGQNTATGDLPMGGNKHTAVGNATALDEYASAADVIDQDLIFYVDTGAADAYVITPATPAITAYEEGQRFVFRAAAQNTGASTLNVNALGATTIETNDAAALGAGAIVVGGYYEVTYDANGSRFVMTSPSSLQLNASGDVDHDATTNFVADEHVDHTAVTITAGEGLSYSVGGTDISADATLDIDLSSATTIEGNALAATDRLLVDDGGTIKAIEVQEAGMRVQLAQTTQTLAAADMNSIMEFTGTATLTLPLNATTALPIGVPVVLNVKHATQVLTVTAATSVTLVSTYHPAGGSAASDVVSAGGTALLYKTAADVWCLGGDIADS